MKHGIYFVENCPCNHCKLSEELPGNFFSWNGINIEEADRIKKFRSTDGWRITKYNPVTFKRLKPIFISDLIGEGDE